MLKRSGTGSAQRDVLAEFTDLVCKQNVAVPVAAMHALTMTIADSSAQTWMELKLELDTTILRLDRCGHDNLGGRTNLSLKSGCELFLQHVTRALTDESANFATCRQELARRGKYFAGYSRASRANIAEIGHSFVQDDSTVLVHGNSRVVSELLLKAAQSKRFRVIMTESRPNDVSVLDDGSEAPYFASVKQFADANIPTAIVYDCYVGSIMNEVDLCIVGAEGVMESGGIVNKVGTYTMAICAKAHQKPFYVAVESYKFARQYPLRQSDITDNFRQDSGGASGAGGGEGGGGAEQGDGDFGSSAASHAIEAKIPMHENITFRHSSVDLTPAEYITLLFTDLGVLTPAAVSDELIKLYQ